MSHLHFFMPPQEFFQLVAPVTRKYDASIVFRRFQPDYPKPSEFPPTHRNVELDDPLADIYQDGHFSVVYFSVGPLPQHDQDWSYFESNHAQLLECTGGRLDSKELQMSYLRVVAKQSDARRLFNALKRKLVAQMTRGGLAADGHEWDRIHYSESALQYRLLEKQREWRRT